MPKWATVGYAIKVNNVAPRILNWRCTETPSYVDILKNIFKFKSLTIYKVLGPSDDESKKPYWAGMDRLQYVSPDVDGCVGENDVGDANHNDIEGDYQTTTFKKSELNEDNTTDFSQDDNIQDYEPSNPRGVQSLEFVVVSETSEDVKQLTRPPKLTIKVPRDRKRSALTVSLYTDPTMKRPRKPKMPKFKSDNQVDEEILRSMQSWINDNNNTCMNVGLLIAKPAWLQLLLSPKGWLEGDIKIQGMWSTISKNKKQFKHETYKWDSKMIDYVIGKYPVHASVNWRTIHGILFPANVNGNHWVVVEVNLKERTIKIYDSYLDANSVDGILRWATCFRNMLPSLLVHALPDTYKDPTLFAVERLEEGVPHQRKLVHLSLCVNGISLCLYDGFY